MSELLVEPVIKSKIDNKKIRFSSAPWFNKANGSNVIIGGVGNIGSWVSLFLSRQGCNLFVYDFDTVDEVNLASQLYSKEDIGKTKAQALKGTLKRYVDISDAQFNELGKLTPENCILDKYCFSCFDNMLARKTLFEAWLTFNKDNKDAIFIDGRLLAELGQVFIVTLDRAEDYKKTLFDDNEVMPEDCSYKGTTHCSAIIAGLMVGAYNNYLTNLAIGKEMRDLPFNIDYQLPLFNFDIKP